MESIRSIRDEELDRLKPLWLALQDHHMRISPRLADLPKRLPEESWSRRRAKYARWLESQDTFVLVSERDGDLLGYAFVTIGPGYASWDSGDQLAELETLSIAPAARGQGVGSRLLAAVRARLASDGIARLAVTSAVTNVGSHRFYERHGLNVNRNRMAHHFQEPKSAPQKAATPLRRSRGAAESERPARRPALAREAGSSCP